MKHQVWSSMYQFLFFALTIRQKAVFGSNPRRPLGDFNLKRLIAVSIDWLQAFLPTLPYSIAHVLFWDRFFVSSEWMRTTWHCLCVRAQPGLPKRDGNIYRVLFLCHTRNACISARERKRERRGDASPCLLESSFREEWIFSFGVSYPNIFPSFCLSVSGEFVFCCSEMRPILAQTLCPSYLLVYCFCLILTSLIFQKQCYWT